jgi:hypothetical protein
MTAWPMERAWIADRGDRRRAGRKEKVMTKVPGRQRRRWLGSVGVLLASVVLTVVAGGLPAYASATSFTANAEIPIDFIVFVPCANGGAGEPVDISGSLHDLFHITVDDSGGVHVKAQDNPQGVQGVGEVTGTSYQGTGVTQEYFNEGSGGLPFLFTFVNNFRIIGQGPDNNFTVHETTHVTVNPNGTVTAFVDNFSATCS